MHVVAPRLLWIAALFLAALLFASTAFAQDCRFPACDRAGETFNPTTGVCQHTSGTTRTPTCRADETLDRATGMCVLNACGSCQARRLCPTGSTYLGSGRDTQGVYGLCGRISSPVTQVRCPAGFTLNEARGVCVGACGAATPTAGPDLDIRRAFLRQVAGGPQVQRVRRGQPYWACFIVANVGTAPSGPFRVLGGGLGVATAPSQGLPSLTPGTSREGCLAYPTTPAAGTYQLGMSARAGVGVTETRTDNNSTILVVNVTS